MLIISWRTGWAGTHGSRRAWSIRCRETTPTWSGPAGAGNVSWRGATGTAAMWSGAAMTGDPKAVVAMPIGGGRWGDHAEVVGAGGGGQRQLERCYRYGGHVVRRRHDGRPEADRGDADGGGRADTGQPGPAESDPEHVRTPFTVLL